MSQYLQSKVKLRRRKSKSKSVDQNTTDDEGFESAPQVQNGQGGNGKVEHQNGVAPLATTEDLDDEVQSGEIEKHEVENVKEGEVKIQENQEEPKELSVINQLILNFTQF